MPLPPLPQNNTLRAWLKYTSLNKAHELCFRLPAESTDADVIAVAEDLANGLKTDMLVGDTFQALRVSDAGSIVSRPLAWTAIGGIDGSTVEADDVAKFLALSGRSAAGYRCRITFFTPKPADSILYRIPGSTALHSTVLALEPELCAIDGESVVWNTYTNLGYNAYWQRKVRGS